MNLSRKWLGEFVDVDANDKDFAEIMTMAGSKVETYARLDAEIKNVVVGKVLSMVRHENSDHMWVCQVDVGQGEPVQIVTGAQNVHEGDLVPAALHNSYLPGGVHITKGKLRGVVSNGMLCSLKELNLTLNDFPYAIEDGIWILQEDCTVGQDINEVIGNDDTVVEFEITNNRPDCFSLIGLAREAAAAFNQPMRHHEPVVKGGGPGVLPELLDVEVPAADLCSRYTARMVRNVKIAPSPKWMRERLRSAGVRPINNIVDITNYVMIEYGQPMHAFDYRYVKGGKIIVRRAEAGETLTTLDGNVRPLQPGMLVIADETRPVGLAGIMGGENSEIVDDTVDVVFESANFNGTSIRQTALALGMRTEASAKFEKNLDPLNTLPAVDRACELVELLGAGEVLDGVIDILNFVPQPVVLPLETDKINRLLGLEIPEAEMVEYLRRLEIPVENGMVQVPSWRSDLKCMADIAEEVARLYGYNRIPTTLPHGATTLGGYSAEATLAQKAGIVARGLGYSEILTYSFDSPKMFDAIRLPADSPLRETVKILNPLGEDTSVMRTTALPAMLETLQRNVAYHNKAAKFYEVATIYLPQPGQVLPNEPKILSLGAYGAGVTFFTLKGEIESLLQCLGLQEAEYTPVTDDPSFHPGRCARLTIAGQDMGIFGQIHPLVAQNYDMDCEVYAAQLNFTGFMSVRKPDCVYCPLPKYPTVSRDLALVCDEDKTVGCVEKCIASAGGQLLKSVRLFDVYRGPGIPEGKKSLAFSLELRADDRTLTDEDSAAVVQKILAKLDQDLGVKLR
ncbi:MAG TPA: phenylalanine--tRNA ligase subunit beta [Candidatus Avoscillospira stercorigallinarum]|uniref:Phenylalanine--tRNA ligase beta subunit n=1 Tax=Candidatus Avoscillospira stercorigallinarum TaxID=2840708 RepID=A0A9D1CNN9_9FIRM|nr:phenylalanine--tRNA ligase subunit beta [Candidatus Avoscillospira stercorigallinarum]